MTLRLREVRKGRGITLRELAAKTGITIPDLSMLERGQRPAFPGWQRRISKALRVPAAELFGEAENDTGK